MLDALGYKAWLCEDCGDELYIQGIRGGTAEEATTENKEAAGSIFATTFDGGTVEAVVDGANDHRIVMAAAIAASFAQTPVKIKGAQAVAKTYAHFFEDFKSLGGIVHVI
jgi:3-phosphoshikimate 1-carboxyvinyltransferase